MGALRIVEPSAEKPPLALELPKGMAFDDWVILGRRLCASSQALNWHIGDWWAYGEHEYGARAKATAEGIFGHTFGTLMVYGSVARAFEPLRRLKGVTFAHHQEVASLPPQEADSLLERAEQERWSTRELRRATIALRSEQIGERRHRDIIDIRPEQPAPESIIDIPMAEMVVELAEALGRERELSERESMFLERALQSMAKKDPRYLVHWSGEEEIRLVEMLKAGQRPKTIAPELDRSVDAIWRQIGRMGGIKRILDQHQVRPVGRLGLSNG